MASRYDLEAARIGLVLPGPPARWALILLGAFVGGLAIGASLAALMS